MEELWKDIKDYEDLYQISNLGRLRKIKNKIQIIKPIKCTNGYLEYALWKNGKRKVFLVHRLVAQYFIDNKNNLPEVNHIDENIENNSVINLEWITSKDNANYGTRNIKCREANRKNFKRVIQYDLENNIIKQFECISDAAKSVNGDSSFISRVCKGKQKTAYGYIWKFI